MSTTNKAAEGVTRRDFIKTSLIGAAGIAAGASLGPTIVRAQATPIMLGLLGVCSGPTGMAGEASLRGVQIWADEINKQGGLLGRKVEVVQRDTFGKPENTVRYAREFAANGFDFIFPHGTSPEGFAVAGIANDIKKVIFASNETPEFTEDPKVRNKYCFRTARNALLDNIDSGKFAANKSKELGLTRWYTVAPDFAFGRDAVAIFSEYLKKFHPKAEFVGQAWPKLEQMEFTPHLNAIMGAKPDAIFNALFTGDVASFIQQASMYGILDKSKFFGKSTAEFGVFDTVRKAMGKFPAGLYAGTMYMRTFPDTDANHEFNDNHVRRFGSPPLSFTQTTYLAAVLIGEAVKKAKTTEADAVVKALEDLTVKVPMGIGANGTVTMRGRDHQLIYYAMGWGRTISQEPYMTDIVPCNWNEVLAEETNWLKTKGWL